MTVTSVYLSIRRMDWLVDVHQAAAVKVPAEIISQDRPRPGESHCSTSNNADRRHQRARAWLFGDFVAPDGEDHPGLIVCAGREAGQFPLGPRLLEILKVEHDDAETGVRKGAADVSKQVDTPTVSGSSSNSQRTLIMGKGRRAGRLISGRAAVSISDHAFDSHAKAFGREPPGPARDAGGRLATGSVP